MKQRMAGWLSVALVGSIGAWSLAWAPGPEAEATIQEKTVLFPEEAPRPPLGLLPVIFWPEDNPYTAKKAELGRLLYFDARLSSDNSISCATCHDPNRGFTDQLPVSLGIGKQKGGRSAPTVINRAFTTMQFWDGRAGSLEDQAIGPLANPLEMTSDPEIELAHTAVVGRIQKIPGYVEKFREVFGDQKITINDVAKAVATFERCVLSGNSPYDKYKAGDESAMTEEQVRGMEIFFGKAACDACHLGFNFSDESFVNIGIGFNPETGTFKDVGRAEISKNLDDTGAFKTPTLREITNTAPYMHDGSLETLEEVVEHYNKGGVKNPYQDQRIKPLNLTDQEKKDLVSFLHALNGEGWQQFQAPGADEFPH